MGAEERMEDRIKRTLVEELFLTIDPSTIGDDEDLNEKLGIDSVKLLQLMVGLEAAFGVSFESVPFEPSRFATVQKTAELVRELGGK